MGTRQKWLRLMGAGILCVGLLASPAVAQEADCYPVPVGGCPTDQEEPDEVLPDETEEPEEPGETETPDESEAPEEPGETETPDEVLPDETESPGDGSEEQEEPDVVDDQVEASDEVAASGQNLARTGTNTAVLAGLALLLLAVGGLLLRRRAAEKS